MMGSSRFPRRGRLPGDECESSEDETIVRDEEAVTCREGQLHLTNRGSREEGRVSVEEFNQAI
jgi:hypothetical protein